MKYTVAVNFNGCINYVIEAETKEQAINKAEDAFSEASEKLICNAIADYEGEVVS